MKILSSIFTSILAKNDTEQANDDTTLHTSTTGKIIYTKLVTD